MQLILVDRSNYKEAIKIQRDIFPNEDGALNILASLDRELFQKISGLSYPDDHVKYYLAENNHEYVGITGLYYYNFDPESTWLGWYGILKQYRRQGFGKKLLEKNSRISNISRIQILATIYRRRRESKCYQAVRGGWVHRRKIHRRKARIRLPNLLQKSNQYARSTVEQS